MRKRKDDDMKLLKVVGLVPLVFGIAGLFSARWEAFAFAALWLLGCAVLSYCESGCLK